MNWKQVTSYRSNLNVPTQGSGQVEACGACDTLQNRATTGHNYCERVPSLLQTNEARCTELIDLGVGPAVEMQCNEEAFRAGLVTPFQDRGIVPADFHMAHAFGCRSVQVLQDQGWNRLAAVIGFVGLDVDAELVPRTSRDGKKSIGSEHQRPDVQSSVCIMRGHILGIPGNS
jgi:hypothetical protein